MKLYIQVENGNAIEHPHLEENLLEVYGEIPSDWESFTRLLRPVPENKYQYVSPQPVSYTKNADGVWTDVFEIREMTSEEKAEVDRIEAEQQAKIAANFAAREAETAARALKAHRIKTLQNMIQQCNETENWERATLVAKVFKAHESHIFTSFDPIEPPFMKYPKQDENGKWYIPE